MIDKKAYASAAMVMTDPESAMRYESYGEDKVIASMLVNALATHLHETVGNDVCNMDIAEAVYFDVMKKLDELRPEQ